MPVERVGQRRERAHEPVAVLQAQLAAGEANGGEAMNLVRLSQPTGRPIVALTDLSPWWTRASARFRRHPGAAGLRGGAHFQLPGETRWLPYGRRKKEFDAQSGSSQLDNDKKTELLAQKCIEIYGQLYQLRRGTSARAGIYSSTIASRSGSERMRW